MTSTAASSRDTAASMVVGCRSVTSFTWPPSAQAVTVPPSRPSTNASPPPTKNPRSSSSPSCGKWSQPSTLCSAIVLHGSRDPPEPTTQLLIRLVEFPSEFLDSSHCQLYHLDHGPVKSVRTAIVKQ